MSKKIKLNILFVFIVLICSITAVSASENNTISDIQTRELDIISESNTYTDLQNEINKSTAQLNITQDYIYNNATDSKYKTGISIVNRNIVINGNGHTIDGSNQVRMFNVNSSNLTINNLVFANGFAKNGGGLYSSSSNVTLNNVTFINIKTTSYSSCLSTNGNLIVRDSSFINTTSSKGGAIYGSHSEIEVSNCEFKDSNVGWSTIYLSKSNAIICNSSFVNLNGNYSTAIYAKYCNATINKSKFVNLTSNKTAGAIGAKGDKSEDKIYEITITNSEFRNITSAKNGGSLFIDRVNKTTIINSTFTQSNSEFGGAILQLEGNLTIKNSNFTKNSAIYNGGAIYTSYVNLDMNNANLINNNGINGGSLYLDMTNATITNSNFINNSATSNGGAIYTYDTSLFMNNSYFTNNSQFNTTGIYSAFDKNYTATKCNFTDDIISLNNTFYATVVDGSGITLTLVNNSIILENLPSKFNLCDFGWVTSVKNQGQMGSCWAFGMYGSLESALLKATEVEYDFSENNFQNTMLKYSIYGTNDASEGGDWDMCCGYLLSWLGAIPEEYDTYDELGKISPLISTNETIHLQDIVFIEPRKNLTDNNQLKEAVLKYGGLWVTYRSQQNAPYYNSKTSAQYYTGNESSSHAVLLVGWDDNYSKDNFIITPPGDGAFILKNSWGDKFGDDGYLYVSYYDTMFVTDRKAIAVFINNTNPYNKNYQVDFTGSNDFKNYNSSQVWYANQFEATDNDLIAAVGSYFNSSGEKYEISIYVNNVLKHTQSGIISYAGFSTIKLTNYIPIKKGDIFKAVIKGINVPVSPTSRVHTDGNTSFISTDGENWNISEYIVSLKVYTVANSIESSDLVKYYKNTSQFSVNVNSANVSVIFNINGINYTKTSDNNGIASIAINLRPGNYLITTYFNGANKTNNITVLSTVLADNLVKYYKNETQFFAKFLKNDGTPLANKNVTFNINGVFYTKETDKNGVAKLNINLRPGNYTLTAIDPETGLEVSFNVEVLPTIIAKNLTKTYLNASQFSATFIKGDGKILANTNVTFNINGATYSRQSNENGTAILNINLMAGKYILTAIDPLTNLDIGYDIVVLNTKD